MKTIDLDHASPNAQIALTNLNKQRGNALIPTIIAIIITAILTAGAVIGLKWIDDAKVSNELEELASLKTSTIKQAVSMGGSFATIDTPTLAQLNFFPALRVTGTGASDRKSVV